MPRGKFLHRRNEETLETNTISSWLTRVKKQQKRQKNCVEDLSQSIAGYRELNHDSKQAERAERAGNLVVFVQL